MSPGADVVLPALGNTCLNDDVTPEEMPFFLEHNVTRGYSGDSTSEYQALG